MRTTRAHLLSAALIASTLWVLPLVTLGSDQPPVIPFVLAIKQGYKTYEVGESPEFVIRGANSSTILKTVEKILVTLQRPDGTTLKQEQVLEPKQEWHPCDPPYPTGIQTKNPCDVEHPFLPFDQQTLLLGRVTFTQLGTYTLSAVSQNKAIQIKPFTFVVDRSFLQEHLPTSLGGYHIDVTTFTRDRAPEESYYRMAYKLATVQYKTIPSKKTNSLSTITVSVHEYEDDNEFRSFFRNNVWGHLLNVSSNERVIRDHTDSKKLIWPTSDRSAVIVSLSTTYGPNETQAVERLLKSFPSVIRQPKKKITLQLPKKVQLTEPRTNELTETLLTIPISWKLQGLPANEKVWVNVDDKEFSGGFGGDSYPNTSSVSSRTWTEAEYQHPKPGKRYIRVCAMSLQCDEASVDILPQGNSQSMPMLRR